MNPIQVMGELRVPADSSLFIGPGCYIEFQDYYALTLDTSAAYIKAIGTEEDSIIFTSAPGRVWNGIDIYFADTTCEFSYCVIEKAHAPQIQDIFIGSGGAIHCEMTDLDITHSHITNNRALHGMGGGIFLAAGNINLTDNIISGNLCGFGGSGLYIHYGNVLIKNNLFENDTTSYFGGGLSGPIECIECPEIILEENIIRQNRSDFIVGSRLDGSTATIKNNLVTDNAGVSGSSGFYITISDSGFIAYNQISRNSAFVSGGGGGIFLTGSNVVVQNNILTDNFVVNRGGGIYLRGENFTMTNNVVAFNTAGDGGGVFCENFSSTVPFIINNNIIWGNIATHAPQISVPDPPIEVSYCDIEGGWQGVGNIDIDPLFRDTANGDFHLMSTFCGDQYDSPCIDAGDPAIQDILLECDWGLGYQISDMGAYGGGDSTLQAIEDYILVPENFTLAQNYPNPFNSSTRIEYDLPRGGEVTISVYDILGRKLLEPVSGVVPAGRHSIEIDMSQLSSGLYFYILETDDIKLRRKMTYLK